MSHRGIAVWAEAEVQQHCPTSDIQVGFKTSCFHRGGCGLTMRKRFITPNVTHPPPCYKGEEGNRDTTVVYPGTWCVEREME